MTGAPSEQKSRRLILVVEDDAAIRQLLEKALGLRYRVESVGDGPSAIARLTAPGKAIPDLLLCDIMMPGFDGVTVAKKMRALPPLKNVPIVFLTAKSTPKDVIVGIQAGAKHYVTKPFLIADLLAKVAKVLGG